MIRQILSSTPIPNGTTITDVSFADHGGSPLVVCADRYGGLWIWSPATGEWAAKPVPFAHAADPVMEPYPDAGNEFDHIALADVGGRLLLAGGGDEQEPAVWDFETGEIVARVPVTGAYLTDIVAVGGAFVTAEQYAERARFWSPAPDRVLGEVSSLFCLATARACGHDLVLAGGVGAVAWDAVTGAKIASCYVDDNDERIWGVTACDAGGRSFVVGATEYGRVCVWNFDAGGTEEDYAQVKAAEGELEDVEVLTVDGRVLAVTAADGGGLRLWNVPDLGEAGHVSGHEVSVMEKALVDGREVLITGGNDGTIRFWR
ncbi:WD40 repeat domain-containing protein [Phytomonospora sp. NPDC050363]|uniref:WD40 repeat domain-containing protein n=1 Tax=Phytomonospora sp. NPDC050363 TaxID=3155642 RepID=UPI0033C53801